MSDTKPKIDITANEFARLANNFYNERSLSVTPDQIQNDLELLQYIIENNEKMKKKHKVALCFICLNEPYWEFIEPTLNGARTFFLPGHDVEFFLWTDKPDVVGATIFPTEPMEWPMGTLMRYALMLQQEEKLKEFDYIFYCDIDMAFVNFVGDEILSDGLTAAQHPMYALDKKFCPPYEPNKDSASYIPRPGMVVEENGKPRFMPLYFAGGIQGGVGPKWIEAMKKIKELVETDLANGYIPIWNDETAWNKYLFENPPSRVLTPSYVYPDSLINEYYIPIWGRSYQPKIVTITKKFTVSKEAGAATAAALEQLKALR